MIRKIACMLAFLIAAAAMQGCSSSTDTPPGEQSPSPLTVPMDDGSVDWPEDTLSFNERGVPVLTVYVKETDKNEPMDMETYLAGVLAGEMKNDWPMEALRAQAILARTYAVKFLSEKQSKYADADISTDIEEAQAYNLEGVNDRIRQAVTDTQGVVMQSSGRLPYAWFHAHSGGMTALAREGLGYNKAEPRYTRVTRSMESDDAPAEAQAWKATFAFSEIGAACAKQGLSVTVGENSMIMIDDKGDSGRAITLLIDGETVSAPELRIALGSTKMRSTLLTDISVGQSGVTFAGKGYGHGVGMSQWGAYGMAKNGSSAQQIIEHYFQNVSLVQLWGERSETELARNDPPA